MEKDDKNITYKTAGLTINPQLGQVESGDNNVRLGPINMMVLTVLIEANGEVVSRPTLFERVWPNQSVSDDTLTRCISDLRSRLSELTNQQKAIETLPKRGYRWVPPVTNQQPVSTTTNKPIKSGAINWVVAFSLLALLLAGLFTWLDSNNKTPGYTAIALFPIQSTGNTPEYLATEIEDQLRACSLATPNMRFLSPEAIKNRPQNPYPYLLRQFGAQWAVDGTIYPHPDGYRVSLNLVDVNTAIVSYTRSTVISETSRKTEGICTEFLSELSGMLTPR